ncbi:MAG: hypothetical protein ACRD1Y_05675 [Terriglobales bacterium]
MRSCHASLALAAAAAAGLLFSLSTPARADSLSGDYLIGAVVCYNNAACVGSTQTSPDILSSAVAIIPATGSVSLNLSYGSADPFAGITLDPTNNTLETQLDVEPESGGFFGIEAGFETPAGEAIEDPAASIVLENDNLPSANYYISDSLIPLDQLNFDSVPDPNNGFTPLPPMDNFNFAGVTTNRDNTSPYKQDDTFQLGPAVVTPEPAPALLLLTGALGLLALAWRRRALEY